MSSIMVMILVFGMSYLVSELIWFIVWILDDSLEYPIWAIHFFKNLSKRIDEAKKNREKIKENEELKKRDGTIEIIKIKGIEDKFYARKIVVEYIRNYDPIKTYNYFGYSNRNHCYSWVLNKGEIIYYKTEIEVQEAVSKIEIKKDTPKEEVVGTIKF